MTVKGVIKPRAPLLLVGLLVVGLIVGLSSSPAFAHTELIQTNSAVGTNVSFSTPATPNNLLVVICGSDQSATITGPGGFSTVKNIAGTPSQAIFYKVASGGETSLSCGFSSGNVTGMQIYEYDGIRTDNPLDVAASSSGSGGTATSGTVVTTASDDLLVAGFTVTTNTSFTSWMNLFTSENDFSGSGGLLNLSSASFGGGDRVVNSSDSYSTTVSISGLGPRWIGQIAAFKMIPPVLSTDIIDSSGNPVSSPGASFNTLNSSFSCQTVTGALGSSNQKVHVGNFTTNPAWTLTLAATGGNASAWSDGTSSYAYNNPSGSGCDRGQLSVKATEATVVPSSLCDNTDLSVGSNAAFNQGVIDTITLVSGGTSAGTNCGWDITGIPLSQTIPAEQPPGNYSLGLTLTVTAS